MKTNQSNVIVQDLAMGGRTTARLFTTAPICFLMPALLGLFLATIPAPAGSVSETEPNNSTANAQAVACTDVVSASIATGDVDYYVITLIAGQVITADVDSGLDLIMQILAPDGTTYFNDDGVGSQIDMTPI